MPPSLGRHLADAIANFDGRFYPEERRSLRLPLDLRPTHLVDHRKAATRAILDLIDAQAAVLSRDIASFGPYLAEMMRISDVAWHVRVDAGDQRGVIATFISERHVGPADRELMVKLDGEVEAPWQSIEISARDLALPPAVTGAIAETNRLYFGGFRALRARVLDQLDGKAPLTITREAWMACHQSATGQPDGCLQGGAGRGRRPGRPQPGRGAPRPGHGAGVDGFFHRPGRSGGVIVLTRVIRPLRAITSAIRDQHDMTAVMKLAERDDEIGQFAQALNVFHQGAGDRERLQREVLRSQVEKEAAQTASRIKSEFLANMSHELRTPLNAVIGFSDLMMSKAFGDMGPRYEEYARLIHEAGNHLLSLVSDILDLAKIEAGRFSCDFRVFDLKECAESCLPLIARRAAEHGVTVESRMPDGMVDVEADVRACKQILINLLSNAVKFSRAGGTVTLTLRETGGEAEISVRDQGIGIPASFWRALASHSSRAPMIPCWRAKAPVWAWRWSRRLVSRHGGRLAVESQENVGTTITVYLPRRQQQAARAA